MMRSDKSNKYKYSRVYHHVVGKSPTTSSHTCHQYTWDLTDIILLTYITIRLIICKQNNEPSSSLCKPNDESKEYLINQD